MYIALAGDASRCAANWLTGLTHCREDRGPESRRGLPAFIADIVVNYVNELRARRLLAKAPDFAAGDALRLYRFTESAAAKVE